LKSKYHTVFEGEVTVQQTLQKGTILGERFEIDFLAGTGDLGSMYKAKDVKMNKPVALRVIPSDQIVDEADIDRLRLRVRESSSLTHRNIRATFGMGIQEGVGIYIAAEWIDGMNLRALLNKRAEAGKRFSFKGAYNIIGHICNALTYAHKKTIHGSLSPRAIMVSSAGRVKIADWGLSVMRTSLESYAGREKLEAIFWSPEIVKEHSVQSNYRVDIYSLGAIFYELITGVAPERPLKAPSHHGFAKDVDTVVARCMAADPMQRYKSAAEVKDAISELVKKHGADAKEDTTDDDLGIDIEIDLTDMGAPEPGPAPKVPVAAFDSEKSGSMLNAPGLPPPKNDGDPSAGLPPMSERVSTIDMGAVMSNLGKSESAHWMVQKDKFDHGPFTDRELIQMIMLGEVLGKHQLLNMDDGVRKKIKAWGQFDEYLERYRIKKKEQEEQAALVRTEKAETRGTAAKWIIAAGVIGVIALGVGGYFLSRTLRAEKQYTPEEMIAALDSGEIKLKTGGNLIKRKRRGGKGRRRGGKGGSSGGGGGGGAGGGAGNFVDGMSYEDAMNMGVELGSLANSGGQKTLTPGDITNIMDRNVRRFLPCMAGAGVKKVAMDIAISGDGRVMGISVAQGDSKLKKCVASKVRSIKFPKSAAPRTAASWYFELY
jgi:serine/threonine protein kinase